MRYTPAFSLLIAVLICGLCIQPALAESAEEALQAVEIALKSDPNNVMFWNTKGHALERLDRLSEALDAFDKALSIDSSDPWSWSGKSNILNQMGRYNESLSAAEKALAIDSGKADFWNSKGYTLLSLGRYQEALDAFNKGLALDANNPYSQNGRAQALNSIGTGPDSSIQTIQTTPGGNTASATAKDWTDQGQFYLSQGQFSEALGAFDTATAIDPKYAFAWAGKSNALGNLGRLLEALDAANTALSIDSNFDKAWTAKGNALTGLGRNQEGLDAFDKALTLNPNFPPAWTGKGNALTGLSRYQEALDAYNTALSIDPGFINAQTNKKKLTDKLGETEVAKLNGTEKNPVVVAAKNNLSATEVAKLNGTEPAIPILPIAMVLIVLLCAGGIFGFYRMRKKVPVTDAPYQGTTPPNPFQPKPVTPKQLLPDLSDRYTESEFIGKGGFARVFKAKRKDGQFVAVKIPISLDESTGKAFIAELQNWTRLDHPNIVKVYNFNIMPSPYFEMELCDGALADQTKPIESEEAAWILFNICEGLKFAHAQKIFHRDLKPQNILLKNGVPKISDWGLSRVISESKSTTVTSFTPYYAAPEQIGNKAKDERTDIWQLGVILYELVTGVLPFQGDSMIEIGMNIATKDPKRPGELIPDANVIDAVVMKCLEKNPAKRYQSVLELQKDLALYLRENYAELLKTSVRVQDFTRSAYYCGDLVMINMLTGDLPTSYKYLLDLVHYSKGEVEAEAQELSEQIKMRMEMGITEIPEELMQKAENIVHRIHVVF